MTDTTDKELEDLMLSYGESNPAEQSTVPTPQTPSESSFLDSILSRKGTPGRPDEQVPVWNNDMVFLLIDQYRMFKSILDDKQHAKKPVWEKVSENLAGMGCQVTATQCSQKWRNMMLQRRQKRQRQILGIVSSKAVTQPWEEVLEQVAPPIDMEQLAQLPLPPGAPAGMDSPRMVQHIKRKRTEDAILKSLNGSPGFIDRSQGGSPSGSSDPDEPIAKQSRVINGLLGIDQIKEEMALPSVRCDKFDRILAQLEEMRTSQIQFQNEQSERLRLLAERDERKMQLLQQFLGLFGQATRMFMSFNQNL